MAIDVREWLDRMERDGKANYGRSRTHNECRLRFTIDLIRAVIADERAKPEPPKPDAESMKVLCESLYALVVSPEANVATPTPKMAALIEAEIARRVEAATKDKENAYLCAVSESARNRKFMTEAEERERLAAQRLHERRGEVGRLQTVLATKNLQINQLTRERDEARQQLAAWESSPVGKTIVEIRDAERASKNEDIAKLKQQLVASQEVGNVLSRRIDEERAKVARLQSELAEARRPVEGVAKQYACDFTSRSEVVSIDEYRLERNAREAAEKRADNFSKRCEKTEEMCRGAMQRAEAAEANLKATREAWRHRNVDTSGNSERIRILTDADIDAAIAAHAEGTVGK